MAMYWTCAYGANHDPGEPCDCKDSEETEELKRKAFWQSKLNCPQSGQLSIDLGISRNISRSGIRRSL